MSTAVSSVIITSAGQGLVQRQQLLLEEEGTGQGDDVAGHQALQVLASNPCQLQQCLGETFRMSYLTRLCNYSH